MNIFISLGGSLLSAARNYQFVDRVSLWRGNEHINSGIM